MSALSRRADWELVKESPKGVSAAFYDKRPARQNAAEFVRSQNSGAGEAAAMAQSQQSQENAVLEEAGYTNEDLMDLCAAGEFNDDESPARQEKTSRKAAAVSTPISSGALAGPAGARHGTPSSPSSEVTLKGEVATLRSTLNRKDEELRAQRAAFLELQQAMKDSLDKEAAEQLRQSVTELQAKLAFKDGEFNMAKSPPSATRPPQQARSAQSAPSTAGEQSPKRQRLLPAPPYLDDGGPPGPPSPLHAAAAPARGGSCSFIPQPTGHAILHDLFSEMHVDGAGPAVLDPEEEDRLRTEGGAVSERESLPVLAAFLGVSAPDEAAFVVQLTSLLQQHDAPVAILGSVCQALDPAAALGPDAALRRIHALRVLDALIGHSPATRASILAEASGWCTERERGPPAAAVPRGYKKHPLFSSSRILCADGGASGGAAVAEPEPEPEASASGTQPTGRKDLLHMLATLAAQPGTKRTTLADPALLAIKALQALAEAAEPAHFGAFEAPLGLIDVTAWLGAARTALDHASAAVQLLTAMARMPFAAARLLECQEGFALLFDDLRIGSRFAPRGMTSPKALSGTRAPPTPTECRARTELRTQVVQLLSLVLARGGSAGRGGAEVRQSLLAAVGVVLVDELDGIYESRGEATSDLEAGLDRLKASVNLVLLIMLCNGFGPGDGARHVPPDDPLAAALLRMEDFLDVGAAAAVKDKFEDEKLEIVSLLNAFFGERVRDRKGDSIDMTPS